MAKFKLNKPVLLQEEFAAGEVSNPGQNVTPATQTQADQVAVDKTVEAPVDKGAEVRSEIIKDVDSILNNLEALSKQITEEYNGYVLDFEATCEAIIAADYVEVNEDFMANVMKQVNSMKAYGKLKGGYAKYKKNILKAELKKEQELGQFEFDKSDKKAEYEEAIKDKFQKAIDKINQGDSPAVKKKADRDRIRAERDAVISKGAKSVELKLTAAKDKLTKKLDAKIRDMKAKLTELEGSNKIESELIAKQWAQEKLAIDDQHEMDAIDKKLEIQSKFQEDNPEFQEKLAKKAKEAAAKIKKEAAEKKAELEQDLKDAQAQLDAEAEKGSEKEKEARAKISAFLKAGNAYISFLNGVDFEKMEDKEAGKQLRKQKTELSKAYTEANSAVSPKTFADASEGTSEEDAEEQYTSFTKSVSDSVDEFKDKIDAIDFDDADDKEPVKTDGERDLSDKEKESLKKAEAALAKAQEAGDEDKVKRYKKLIANIKDTSTLGEGFDIDASISEIEEGNAFGAARAEAIAKGEKTFKVGDEEYDVEGVDADDKENAEEYAEEEGIATEAVTESKAYQMGSIADRFRSLM